MAIAYRSKYPEASSKASHYQNVAATLQTHYSELEEHIQKVKARKPSDYENTKLRGDYYTKYENKKDDWISQLDQITAKFDSFLLEVDTCIQKANNLTMMWNSRIGITEAYDDGKEN